MVQAIDTILEIPASLETMTRHRTDTMYAFLGALYKSGLAHEVINMPNVTIFVPSDEAFQKVAGAMSQLSEDDLRNLLNYHIIPGTLLYSSDLDLADNFTYNTAAIADTGKKVPLSVTVARNDRFIDSSRIIHPDVLVANGVVHM